MNPAKRCATPDEAPWNGRVNVKKRPVSEGERESTDLRSSYAVDRDRVIHSDTFRELQHKTQVQSVADANSAAGFFRTRLNHVIEVAQIARGVAGDLGANVDLSEAIALAHDLGHPPFGHAGERGLATALAEHGETGWNANVHSLVVVDEIEAQFVAFAGLNLTWATREGIARHSTPFDEPVGFGEFAGSPNAGLESQIVDAADVMAYLAHDLDDALGGGLIKRTELYAVAPILGEFAGVPPAEWEQSPWDSEMERDRVARRRLVAKLIGHLIEDLATTTTARLTNFVLGGPDQVRACSERVVLHSSGCQRLTRDLLALLMQRYYRSDRVRESDARAVTIVKALFDHLMHDASAIPARFGSTTPLRVAAYIASLNDLSAVQLAKQAGITAPANGPSP